MVSPDNHALVVSMATADKPMQYSFWIGKLGSADLQRLTSPPINSWDISPAWSPDGKSVLFVRVRRANNGRLQVALMEVNTETHMSSELLGEEEGVVVAAYGPDGKELAFWSKNGVEVMSLVSHTRTIVLPVSKLQGRQYYSGGGLGWSRFSNKLAFAVFNTATNAYELMTISLDSTDFTILYSSDRFRIVSVSFVRQKDF
ncbi:MAG: hypothetical protein NVS9B5_37290 [Terriglobales bacterium]